MWRGECWNEMCKKSVMKSLRKIMFAASVYFGFSIFVLFLDLNGVQMTSTPSPKKTKDEKKKSAVWCRRISHEIHLFAFTKPYIWLDIRRLAFLVILVRRVFFLFCELRMASSVFITISYNVTHLQRAICLLSELSVSLQTSFSSFDINKKHLSINFEVAQKSYSKYFHLFYVIIT